MGITIKRRGCRSGVCPSDQDGKSIAEKLPLFRLRPPATERTTELWLNPLAAAILAPRLTRQWTHRARAHVFGKHNRCSARLRVFGSIPAPARSDAARGRSGALYN